MSSLLANRVNIPARSVIALRSRISQHITPVASQRLSSNARLLELGEKGFVWKNRKGAVRSFASTNNQGNVSPVTWKSLAVFVATGSAIVAYYLSEKQRRQQQVSKEVTSYGKPVLGGLWTLVDDTGKPRTNTEFLGKWTLLYFGFTRCPDICPNELVKVGVIIDKLAAKGKNLYPLFISVDPVRDTVGQSRAYKQDFHPSFTFLTGTPDQLHDVAKAYRVYFSKADIQEDNDDEYLVDHSIVLYLVDPEGNFVDFFTQSVDAGTSVAKISKYMTEYTAGQQASK